MKKRLLVIIVSVGLLSSCMMSANSLDRAVMLEKNEAEYMVYGSGNAGGYAPEYNIGMGFGARIGMADRFTFGGSADLNYNSTKPQWVNHILYGQVFSVDF
jgi:hypothetical protein